MVQPEKGSLFSMDYFYAARAAIGSLYATKAPEAAIPAMNAGQDLDQSGFARPILADHGVDLAVQQFEIGVPKCVRATEVLGQRFDLQNGRHVSFSGRL